MAIMKLTKTKIKIIVCFIIVYISSYFILSRTSYYLNICEYEHRTDFEFYYIPVKEKIILDNRSLQICHAALSYIYWPIAMFDYYILLAPHYTQNCPCELN